MRGILLSVMILLFTVTVTFAGEDSIERVCSEFRSTFKNMPVDSCRETVIPGLYEVVSAGQILYYSPKGYLIFGEIWDVKRARSVTAERREEIRKETLAKIPLERAIKIGNGPHRVIEFSDPDCPYCRRVAEYFARRDDVTRYVFFFILKGIHPKAENKAKIILCSKDPEATYKEVYSGKYDTVDITISEECERVASRRLDEMRGVALGVSVAATPHLFINGTEVIGADIPRIEALLGKSTNERR